jgi:hypothetical protein
VGTPGVVLNDEAQEFPWLSIDDALCLPLNQPTKALILTVMSVDANGGHQSALK